VTETLLPELDPVPLFGTEVEPPNAGADVPEMVAWCLCFVPPTAPPMMTPIRMMTRTTMIIMPAVVFQKGLLGGAGGGAAYSGWYSGCSG